ncbi:PSP1 C-terminal conserved region-domain-containing protein [Radiomyces spectabilis]|uniref:PSP1 C-terminal conserved region-domain-containing protein n=1 Tax=Radiomyces spectabilis TaxID=64574 RepID=UPI00221FE8C5|nr:PSP1 C-terminal conserved region-domain-containing protein [Radiomyces spectabilis]KAI8388784.1 PSP1 C-terminal conserved region-domain-containing protein [Radiomyces spectabilis]
MANISPLSAANVGLDSQDDCPGSVLSSSPPTPGPRDETPSFHAFLDRHAWSRKPLHSPPSTNQVNLPSAIDVGGIPLPTSFSRRRDSLSFPVADTSDAWPSSDTPRCMQQPSTPVPTSKVLASPWQPLPWFTSNIWSDTTTATTPSSNHPAAPLRRVSEHVYSELPIEAPWDQAKQDPRSIAHNPPPIKKGTRTACPGPIAHYSVPLNRRGSVLVGETWLTPSHQDLNMGADVNRRSGLFDSIWSSSSSTATQKNIDDWKHRRYSSHMTDYWLSTVVEDLEGLRCDEIRRHSVAGVPLGAGRPKSGTTDSHHKQQRQQQQILHQDLLNHIDDYFATPRNTAPSSNATDIKNTESQQQQHLGKGVPLHQFLDTTRLFCVQFKVGRTELVHVDEKDENTVRPKIGDLVIVEGDRGQDLGTVIKDDLTVADLVKKQSESENNAMSDLITYQTTLKDLHVKRLYRLATACERAMLDDKLRDEQAALLDCQARVRQKNLPMDVVDAEYQWDRRKLTFYFVANERIDFRELVRELFKLYKTRIWMCATTKSCEQMNLS